MRNKYINLILIAGLIVITDQITKFLILKGVSLYESITIIPGLINIVHVQNNGIVFGIFRGINSNIQQIILLIASLFGSSLVLYFYINMNQNYRMMITGFALIFGGALGNLVDRIRLGRVVDFIDIYYKDYHWPAFNVADSSITIGVLIFCYYIFFKRPENFFKPRK
jgi:signal peptidase II